MEESSIVVGKIRFYTPIPALTLSARFGRMAQAVGAGLWRMFSGRADVVPDSGKVPPFTLCPQPLEMQLLCAASEDWLLPPSREAAASQLAPEGAIAWRYVDVMLSSEGRPEEDKVYYAMRVIADEVMTLQTVRGTNPALAVSLERGGYTGLARRGDDVFIPLREKDVVTDGRLMKLWPAPKSSKLSVGMAPPAPST